jgi:methylated-DNA-[protein]-cysteine S-methyltransferase
MRNATGFALFDTAIGICAIAWSDSGVAGVQLPETDAAATQDRMVRRFPEAAEATPPVKIQRAIDGIVALATGKRVDFWPVVLDLDGIPAFERRVYAVARTIPAGQTSTYGEIARRLDDIGLSRSVGQALGRNPFAIIVPCHRVLAANGKSGGFSANGGVTTKLRLLNIEKAAASGAPLLFDELPLMVAPRRALR